MSDRRAGRPAARERTAAAALIVMLVAVTAQAQSPVPTTTLVATRQAFERALTQHDSAFARIGRRLDSLEGVARHVARDTTRIGSLVMASSPNITDAAQRALREADDVLTRRWGAATLRAALAQSVLRVILSHSSRLGVTQWSLSADVLRYGRIERLAMLTVRAADTVGVIREHLEGTVADLVGATVDQALGLWLGRARVSDPAPRLEASYVDLYTAPSVAVRQCAAGRIARCAAALGLAPVADPKTELFTEEDRRVVARAWWATYAAHRVELRAVTSPCDRQPMSAPCRAFVDSLSPTVWQLPLGHEARHALIWHATVIGGDAAWQRLLANPDAPLAARIVSAAGQPLDTVLAGWRSRVLRARPDPVRPRGVLFVVTAGMAMAGLGSAIVFRSRT